MQENRAHYHIHLRDALDISPQGEEWMLGAFQYCWNNGSELNFSANKTLIEHISQGRLQSLAEYFTSETVK